MQLQNKEALTCSKNPSCSCSCSQQLAASGISCSRALIQLSGQQERASGCPGSLRASTGKAPPCRPGAGCGASLHWVWKLLGVIFFFFFWLSIMAAFTMCYMERTFRVQGLFVCLLVLTDLFSVGSKPGLSYHRTQCSQEWGPDARRRDAPGHFIFVSSLFMSNPVF